MDLYLAQHLVYTFLDGSPTVGTGNFAEAVVTSGQTDDSIENGKYVLFA
jgi:hypothetical protein